jgi:tetratricopeptide (TPR) repeat protein/DNA-binding XRE family transcriptional regulator
MSQDVMRTFGELLREYMERTGISDAELARTLGVRRQTIFRWKEGTVARPRHVEDVMRCAERLRLRPEERDLLLVAAGFPPENSPTSPPRAATVPLEAAETSLESQSQAAPARVSRRGVPPRWAWAIGGIVALALIALAVILWARWASYPTARQGEALLLVAPFANYAGGGQGYNVAGRVQEALAREIDAGRLTGVRAARWPQEIRDPATAAAALDRSAAALAIWGEYDSGRVLAHLSRRDAGAGTAEQRVEKLLPSPADLSATINTALPEEVRSVALLSLAQLFTDREDYARARATLGQVLARPPADPQAAAGAYFLLCYVDQLEEPPDLDGAIEACSQALAGQSDTAAARYNRGLAYLRRGQEGDYARAVDDFSQAAGAMPGDAALFTNRGAAYLHLAEQPGEEGELQPAQATARAVEDFDQAIALDPGLTAAYFNRGLAYVRQDDRARWLPNFERVLSLAPDHAGAYNALCWAYALDHEPELALPYCDKAVALDPTGTSRDSRGIVYAEMGRYTEALADLKAYLVTLQGQDPDTYRRLGLLREAWVQALENGQHPFDQAMLDALRTE